MKPIWVVDDDRSIRWVLEKALQRAEMPCRLFKEAEEVVEALKTETPSVLLSDIRMHDMTGVELLNHVKTVHPEIPVIIMTAFGDLDSAVSAFQGGAYEYLAKPFDINRAVELLRRACEERAAAEPAEEAKAETSDIVGQSRAMQEVFRAIGRLSQSNVTVLITGESGTGKEVVARALHQHSPRKHAPYVAINTAAIPRLRAQTAFSTAGLNKPKAAPSFWTKSATCRWKCRRACCGCCPTAVSTAWAAVS